MRANNQKQLEEKAENIRYLLSILGEKGMTAAELIKESFMIPSTAHRYIKELKKNKVIYVSGYRGSFPQYSVGSKPDVKFDKTVKLKEVRVEPKFVPRPDIAAAWLFNPVG